MLSTKFNWITVKTTQLFNVKFMQTSVSLLSATNREARIMTKVMQGSKKSKKRIWYTNSEQENILSNTMNSTALGLSGGGKVNIRRQHVMNKLYMRHITDQMASDEAVIGKGIQITKIKVSPDFQLVNVYWLCNSSIPSGTDLPTLLDNYSRSLRYNLTQLHTMGNVPPIKFLPDKQLATGITVDHLLTQADFGNDGEDLESIEIVSQDKFSEVCLSSQPKDLLSSRETVEETLPSMRHDIFGLNQEEIMMRVKRNMKKITSKSKEASRDPAENLRTIEASIAEFHQHDRRNLTHQLRSLNKLHKGDKGQTSKLRDGFVNFNEEKELDDDNDGQDVDDDFPDEFDLKDENT